MNILAKIKEYARSVPERNVMISGGLRLTWRELWEYSERLAGWLAAEEYAEAPVAVYGHKHPWMLVCFLACVKAGHGYCPIDLSVPKERVKLILEALPSRHILAPETDASLEGWDKQGVGLQKLEEIFRDESLQAPSQEAWVHGDETWCIIFTSGSTGTPKGVQITADCLGHYLDWSVGLGTSAEQKLGQIFLNQAPFSFDLSVMDLYTCLASGGTLFCLEKSVQSDYGKLVQALGESGANVWVSTPSFAEMCLSEPKFRSTLLPGLQVFLFCGETLGNRTARKLQERFPGAAVVNTYGPTESTVAVTGVLVTPKLAAAETPLPVGRAKPGTRIEIHDTEGKCVPDGQKGEIIIIGDTVSTGYYKQEELTRNAFFTVAGDTEGAALRAYHTGDEGYLRDGMLYYCGRIDLQIKLHGYRIEPGDIESNIRTLPEVAHAAVVPNFRGGKVSSLTAFVVPETPSAELDLSAVSVRLRERLGALLPAYMIPKKFVFLDQMPVTDNGKIDRKKLGGRKT